MTELQKPLYYPALDKDEKISLLNDMLNISVDCIKLISTDGSIIFMNQSGCRALGVSPSEQQFGMDWLSLLPESVHKKGRVALTKALRGECAGFRGISVCADNSIIYWDNMLSPVCDKNGNTVNILCISRNITDQVKAEEDLRFLSERDSLTGLANRRSFKQHLQKEIVQAKKDKHCVGLLYIDLDNFKDINDTLGHAAGDKAIKQVASELIRLSAPGSFISRLGGDEFAIIIRCMNPDELAEFANKILVKIKRGVIFRKSRADFGITIGAALFPAHGERLEELLHSADRAMYTQKKNGKNGLRIYDAGNILEMITPSDVTN